MGDSRLIIKFETNHQNFAIPRAAARGIGRSFSLPTPAQLSQPMGMDRVESKVVAIMQAAASRSAAVTARFGESFVPVFAQPLHHQSAAFLIA